MIGLLQRVSQASVVVQKRVIAEIAKGLVVFVAVEHGDTEAHATQLLGRLTGIRVFPDRDGRMNLNILEAKGSMLLVPQFTLAADTRKGNRPGFSGAAVREEGSRLFEYLVAQARNSETPVYAGKFGAEMQVNISNEGPVTLWLRAAGYH